MPSAAEPLSRTPRGRPYRLGVAMLVQESNTFTPGRSNLHSFTSQGLWTGERAGANAAGTNTEIAGAIEAVTNAGHTAVPIVRGWAMSGGVLEDAAFEHLAALMTDQITRTDTLDGLVLCLHGALTSERHSDADSALVERARAAIGPDVPIVVSLDLHANVTQRLVESVDGLVGFRTYPHVDQAESGARAARLLMRVLNVSPVVTRMQKLPLLVPAESQGTSVEPMHGLRAAADEWMAREDIHDVSLFPVQPWLDVEELGFAVTVVADNGTAARAAGDHLSAMVWSRRGRFSVDLVDTAAALRMAMANPGKRPAVLVHSSDSPTSGCTADSPAVLAHLEQGEHGPCCSAVAVVDEPAVRRCAPLDLGARITLKVGASLNATWDRPVTISGIVSSKGSHPIELVGPSMTGQKVSIGSWVVVKTTNSTYVLLTEAPAPTFDPATWIATAVPFEELDVVSIRSANMFRAGYAGMIGRDFLLDLPGASTPNLRHLVFTKGAQHIYPFVDIEDIS